MIFLRKKQRESIDERENFCTNCSGFIDGEVAQSVEQRTENPCVGGSIPPLATMHTFIGLPYFGEIYQTASLFAANLCVFGYLSG